MVTIHAHILAPAVISRLRWRVARLSRHVRLAVLSVLLLFGLLSGSGLRGQERLALDLEEGKSGAVWDIALSADGGTLYTGGRDSTAKSWDLSTGEAIRMFKTARPTLMTTLALDHRGDWLALGDMNGHLSVWNARNGILSYDFQAHGQYISSIAIATDGRTVVTTGRDGRIGAWQLDDGTPRWSVTAPGQWINAVAIAPDGAVAATAAQDGEIRLWRMSDGGDAGALGRHSRFARTVLFSSDGAFLFSGGADGRVIVWDLQTRAIYREFVLDTGYPHDLALDASGEQLLVCRMNGLLSVWDWKRRQEKKKLPPESYGTMAARFSPDGRRIYSAHTAGTVKIWNSDDATLLLDMAGFSDGQWLSFTPDGYYDCSAYGDRYVRWRKGQERFPLERYRDLYHRPAVIEDVLRGGYTPTGGPTSIEDPPRVELRAPRDGQLFAFGSEELEIVVDVRAVDRDRIESVTLLLNERQVSREQLREWVEIERSDSILHVRCRLRVLPGRNSIEAVAFNAARVRSTQARAMITVETSTRLNPNLYVLAVGSDRYAPHYPDLQFAGIDAEALADELSRQEGGLYARVYAKRLIGKDVSRDRILAALKDFADIRPEDMLVLFFSGHGVRERGTNGKTRYYYLPAGTTRTTVTTQGLAWEDFAAEIARLRAGRVIMLLDACHSGDVSGGASNEKVAASLAGQLGVVFTSSSGNEYSFEDRAWGHGAFTRALLDGIAGKADFTRDAVVDWSELQLYVSTAVRSMTRGGQNPMVPRLEQFANFDFVRVQ
ncbi:MAG: caspase family protein [Bacteroidota bacterium]|jgi:WD40 repeat protein|nr:caspase family protein [Bacteroidota bacterium]